MEQNNDRLIRIDYNDLVNLDGDISEKVAQAFGIDGLGLIAVKNVPGYVETRRKILEQGFKMANIDIDTLKQLELSKTNYSLGWQKGNTYFNGKWEALTGAFYARVLREVIDHSDPEMQKKYTNVWPSEELLPSFKHDFLEMGRMLTHCQQNLLYHLDKYTKTCYPQYKEFSLYNKMKSRNDTISRLIMYYPAKTYDEEKYGQESKDNWCGWHRDFGVLTGLTHAIYYKENGEVVSGLKSGLTVKDRKHQLHDLTFNEDEILIQSGDVSFIMTGGSVISTPHCVKITDDIPKDVFRITLINFFDPCYEEMIDIPEGIEKEKIYEKDPLGMKYMITKFNEPCTYQSFITNAFNTYYSGGKKNEENKEESAKTEDVPKIEELKIEESK
jgi:isopenicillin N synthase-like dioxygenase